MRVTLILHVLVRHKICETIEVEGSAVPFGSTVARIPLHRGDVQIKRNYCAFWRKDNSGYYIEEFGAILKKQFEA